MNEPVRILLVTPEPVQIDLPTDCITVVSREPTAWSDVIEQLPGFTHLAVGPVGGTLASDQFLETVTASQPQSVSIMALPGYDWIESIVDKPFLLSVLPQVLDGALIVAPIALIRQPAPQPWLEEAGYRLASPLLDMISEHAAKRFIRSNKAIGVPRVPFLCPFLTPDLPATDAGNGSSIKADRQTLERIASNSDTLMAGWLQINDDLDASHALSQSMEGHRDADYWHAIMHRREPDYGNSKYWFRRVGRHPVFRYLARRAAQILSDAPAGIAAEWAKKLITDSGWDSFAFVDMCQQAAADEDSDLGLTARRIQWIEMLLLLEHCARTP